MEHRYFIENEIELLFELPDEEGTSLQNVHVEKERGGKLLLVHYTVQPGSQATAMLPQVKIKMQFPIHEVTQLMSPKDFSACSRTGMWYSSSLECLPIGWEPFFAFTGVKNQVKYFFGLANLEYASRIEGSVYGQPPQEYKDRGMVNRFGKFQACRNMPDMFKGQGPKPFHDVLYIDRAGDNVYEALRNYYQWLRDRFYPGEIPNPPADGDEPMYHTWYSLMDQINEHNVMEHAKIAGQLGLRRFHIDACWDVPPQHAPNIWGPHIADQSRFSNFRKTIDEMHALGLRVMLHARPMMCDPSYEGHSHMKPFLIDLGRNPGCPEEAFLLCPRCPEVHDYIKKVVTRLVSDYGIDEIWFDFVDDYHALYGDCKNNSHRHLPGTPGENMIQILKEMQGQAYRCNPRATIWGRREEGTPATIRYQSHLFPHDRYLDYQGNLRECLKVRALVKNELVQTVCMDWPDGEKPEVVARHLVCGIFGGVLAISIVFSRQSPENMRVIREYVKLYRTHKSWTNLATRIQLCPDNPIGTLRIDGPGRSWVLSTGAWPGLTPVVDNVQEIRLFSTAYESISTIIPVQGEWEAKQFDHFLVENEEIPLEKTDRGILIHATGTPAFGVILRKVN